MSPVQTKNGRIVVMLRRLIQWSFEAELPRSCPECEGPVEGFDTIEVEYRKVNYSDECEAFDNDGAEGSGEEICEVRCNACGHALATERVSHPSTPKAMDAANALAAVIDDENQERVHEVRT